MIIIKFKKITVIIILILLIIAANVDENKVNEKKTTLTYHLEISLINDDLDRAISDLSEIRFNENNDDYQERIIHILELLDHDKLMFVNQAKYYDIKYNAYNKRLRSLLKNKYLLVISNLDILISRKYKNNNIEKEDVKKIIGLLKDIETSIDIKDKNITLWKYNEINKKRVTYFTDINKYSDEQLEEISESINNLKLWVEKES